jgi:hypothetical protein
MEETMFTKEWEEFRDERVEPGVEADGDLRARGTLGGRADEESNFICFTGAGSLPTRPTTQMTWTLVLKYLRYAAMAAPPDDQFLGKRKGLAVAASA